MYQEKIIKKLRKKNISMLVLGTVMLLLGAFLLFCFIVDGDTNAGMYFIMGLFAVIGLVLIIQGIVYILDPTKNHILKANPRLLEMADDLFSNVKFEDKIIIMSDKVIASKRDLTQMAYFDEVLMIYEYTHTTNMVTDTHKVKLETADYTALIDVYAYKEDAIDGLIKMLFRMCPNAVPCQNQQELYQRISAIGNARKERKKMMK